MFFNKIYNSWESIQIEKYEEIFRVLGKDFFALLKDKLVLDIGSGNGFFEKFLSGKIDHKIITIDIENSSVIGSGDKLPFKKNSFDAIISLDTMHLIKENDFKRILKENGLVLFSIFFNKTNYAEKREFLKRKLKGFEILLEFEINKRENEYVVLAKNNF